MSDASQEVVIDLGENGQFAFKSVAELKEWLTKEKVFWSGTLLGERFGALVSNIQQIERWNEAGPDSLAKLAELVQKGLSSSVVSTSVRSVFIQSLREKGGLDAVKGALSYFLKEQVDANMPERLRGFLLAHEFEKGSADTKETIGQDLLRLRSELDRTAEEAKKSVSQVIDEAGRARNQLADWQQTAQSTIQSKAAEAIDNAERDVQTALDQLKKQAADAGAQVSAGLNASTEEIRVAVAEAKVQVENAKQELQRFKEAMEKQMALQAPVNYWNRRRWIHGAFALGYGLVNIAAFAGAAVGIWLWVDEHLPLKDLFDWPRLPLGKMVMTAVFITLGLWLLRTLVRLFLMHLHLSTDAGERVVLIQTYLAMLKEGQATLEDRPYALQAVFRTVVVAPPKESSAPPNLAAVAKG